MQRKTQNIELGTQPTDLQQRRTLVIQTVFVLLIPVFMSLLSVIIIRFTVQIPAPSPPMVPPFGRTNDGGPLVPIVVLVVFFSALILLIRARQLTAAALVVIGLWTLFTTIGALLFGITSVFPALLLLPICAAGLLIDGIASMSLAGLAMVLVGSIAWLDANKLINRPTLASPVPLNADLLLLFGFWTGMFWTVAALTSLLAGNLQRALAQSRAQARELETLSAQLEARVAEQTAQLIDQEREAATLEERTRLARDIHDTLAQGLTGIVVQLGAAQQLLAGVTTSADQQIDLAQRMARESLAEARRSVWNLRSPALERGDVGDALRALATRPIQAATTVSFAQHGQPYPLAPAVESALLRVAQEALVNVAKHAQATAVTLNLTYEPAAITVTIRDNGIGFAPGALEHAGLANAPWGGFGLLGMRERIAALGGTLDIRSEHGVTVVARVAREGWGDTETR